jgi:hypothetical protein
LIKILKLICGALLTVCMVFLAAITFLFDGNSISLLDAVKLIAIYGIVAVLLFAAYLRLERIEESEWSELSKKKAHQDPPVQSERTTKIS